MLTARPAAGGSTGDSMSKPIPIGQRPAAGGNRPGAGWRFWSVAGGVVAVAVGLALLCDGYVQNHLRVPEEDSTPAKVATWVSESAKGHWPVIAGLLLIAGGHYRQRVEWRRLGLLVILATGLAGLAAMSARSVIGRTRPNNPVEQGWFGPYHDGRWNVGRPAYSSFPSGHTATATGLAFAFILVRSRWRGLGVGWALAVAWSRMALNFHHLSDTVAAAAFGFAGAWWVVQWMESDHFKNGWLCRVAGLHPAATVAVASPGANQPSV
jgi:membrane-associated phospholipid phosphatase